MQPLRQNFPTIDGLEFGQWFRNLRKLKGLAAYKISKKAGLTSSYFSDIERGRNFPKRATLAKIADAMGLSPLERAELESRASRDRPAKIKVEIPGLAIWKHLPTAIFQVEHRLFELYQTDEILPDAVRFFSGLLGCIALHRGMLTDDRRQEVVGLVQPRLKEMLGLDKGKRRKPDSMMAGLDWHEARRRVMIAWRQAVFADSTATDELVSLISEWSYQRSARAQPQFTVLFKDKRLARVFDVDHGPLRRMMHVYDFFTSQWLLSDRTIAAWIADFVHPAPLSREMPDAAYVLRSLKKLSRIAAMTPDQMYEKASSNRGWSMAWFGHAGLLTQPFYLTLHQRMRCLYELPPAAREQLPPRAAYNRLWTDTRAKFNQVVLRLKAHDVDASEEAP